MSAVDQQPIVCPKCRKKYRWKPELAGKKVKCKKCGTQFRFPKAMGQEGPAGPGPAGAERGHKKPQVRSRASEFSPYDIEDPDDSAAGKKADVPADCPLCGALTPPGQIVCTKCGYNRQTRQREAGAKDGAKKTGGRGRWAAVMVALLLAGAAGGGYYYFMH
jgi:hypothetical protein